MQNNDILKILLFSLLVSFQSTAMAKAETVPADTSAYFISFDGVKIYYEVRGRGGGEPVLLVHGFIVNGESWKMTAVYTGLINAGYKVITMDLRGNGKSDKPREDSSYANDAEAKDLMGLVSWLGIDRYNIVGYSRGSIITARLLVKDKRVSKAVMGGMGADFTDPNWTRRIRFYRALSGDSVKELESMVNYVKKSGLDQQVLAWLQKEQPSTSKEELGAVTQPVLVICGDQDTDNGSADQLVKLFKHGTRVSVPGDHGSASRSPEFSARVISFLMR